MIAAGATVINIPDTTGYCLPGEFGELVHRLIADARGADKVLFSVHCHDDLGLATANALAALTAGARASSAPSTASASGRATPPSRRS